MNTGFRIAAAALIAFAGGFFLRGLTTPQPAETPFDPASLVTSRSEGGQVILVPTSNGQALIIANGERPTAAGEIGLQEGRSVFVGWTFGRLGGRAIPCMPPNDQIPGCTPVDPPDTFVYCYGGEDDGPRRCVEVVKPEPPIDPNGPVGTPERP